ncbi:hypothetical protein HY374_03290 [Candidatus Berkelbacteria bacterium]|nr:hypothetical protein [Candidatus Berkelbacteria bacterium]
MTAVEHHTLRGQLAYLISAVASPFVIFPLLVIGATWGVAASPSEFLAWAGVLLLTTGVIPACYILWGVRAGRITDIHIMVREQRAIVFLVFLVSAAAGLALLWLLEAPRTIFLLALIAFGNGLLAALITLFWKVSIHAWVYAGAAASFALLADAPWGWWLLLGLPLVIWARTHRQRHTIAQGVGGGLLGLGLTYLLYLIIFSSR